MEIKVQGNKDWTHTDPHKVPPAFLKKYPEAHARFIGISSGQVRRRLDEGYQFVPIGECGDGIVNKLAPLAEQVGLPSDVYIVGDTVLMVNHKTDAEAKRTFIDKSIKDKTKNLKEEAKENVKDLGGVIEKEVIKKETKAEIIKEIKEELKEELKKEAN